MSVFYDVLMEKSAQRQEREDDKGLFGPILPVGTAAGGAYLGRMLDTDAHAQREYAARTRARIEKSKPIRDALDALRVQIRDAANLVAQHHDSKVDRLPAERRLNELIEEQARMFEELKPHLNNGDKPQRLYRGKLLGAAVGGGLGYGAKKLFDRYNARKRSEQG